MVLQSSNLSKLKENIYLGKSHHCFTISSCDHVCLIHLMFIIHDINQLWKLEFYWNKALNVFLGWEYVVIDSLFIIKKIAKKKRIFKEGEKENFTSSMFIGYYFLFWWLFVNESPLNANFVLGCSPLWLHHKFWFKNTTRNRREL
jgi:hypothetical protein